MLPSLVPSAACRSFARVVTCLLYTSVPGGTEVIAVEQVTVWRWYRGLAGIVRAEDTDGAGVRSGS